MSSARRPVENCPPTIKVEQAARRKINRRRRDQTRTALPSIQPLLPELFGVAKSVVKNYDKINVMD
jgi:hypothetical protein